MAYTNPQKPQTKGLSPEWANLPRRNCADCGKSYKPKRPLRPTDKYGFCSPTCKKSFHKHGGAYRKLRDEMRKLVEKGIADLEKRLKKIVVDEFQNRAMITGFGSIPLEPRR